MEPIKQRRRHDFPGVFTAFQCGQEDFIRANLTGVEVREPDLDPYRLGEWRRGFESEKGDWYQRPVLQ